ncbi:MAG TPA: HAD family hydrolase [Acidimicrobiales bacterium]|nr:HAD family hydrolase [Acidimicrobiales bacterium]
MIDAFVFDFDGLIVDTEWCEYVSIAEQFEHYGQSYAVEHFQQFVGTAWPTGWTQELIATVGEPLDTAVLHAARRLRRDELLCAMGVLPGVVELLDLARAHGMALAVASSSTRDWVEPHLERLGIRDRFAAVLTRDDVEHAKPAPDLFAAAARELDVAAGKAIVFEDSFNGCTAAKAAGMVCVVAPNRITAIQDFAHADLVVPSLAHVEIETLRRLINMTA